MSRMPATERYIIGWTIDFANTSNGGTKLNFFLRSQRYSPSFAN